MASKPKCIRKDVGGHPVWFLKRYRYYLAIYYDAKGKRRQKSTRRTTINAAEVAAKQIIQEAHVAPVSKRLRLDSLFDQCNRAKVARAEKKQATIDRTDRGIGRMICRYLETQCIQYVDQLNKEVWEMLKEHLVRQIDRKTVNNRLTILKAAVNWAEAEGLIQHNPLSNCKLILKRQIKGARTYPKGYDDREIVQIMNAARGTPEFDIICLIASTGIRRGEAIGLTVGDVDDYNGDMKIRIEEGKSSAPRVAPVWYNMIPGVYSIADQIRQLVADRHPSEPLFVRPGTRRPLNEDRLSKAVRALVRAANVRHRRNPLHAFRHTVPVKLLLMGISVHVVKEAMGHKDIRTTMIYVEMAGTDLDQSIQRTRDQGPFFRNISATPLTENVANIA